MIQISAIRTPEWGFRVASASVSPPSGVTLLQGAADQVGIYSQAQEYRQRSKSMGRLECLMHPHLTDAETGLSQKLAETNPEQRRRAGSQSGLVTVGAGL